MKLENFPGISSRIEPKRISSIEANRIFSIFRCFFIKIVQMHQIHHVKSFRCIKTKSSVRSNRIYKNIKILKKFELREPMFNSVRFGSIG